MVAAYFPGKVTTFESEQIMLALTCPLSMSGRQGDSMVENPVFFLY